MSSPYQVFEPFLAVFHLSLLCLLEGYASCLITSSHLLPEAILDFGIFVLKDLLFALYLDPMIHNCGYWSNEPP
jgi:hypothetical protein